MMIDLRRLVDGLRVIESVAIIPRVTSTNELAQRILKECIENEIDLPRAVIVAREQLAGRGRNARSWHSPKDKGIYATTTTMLTPAEARLLPLRVGVGIVSFLRDTFAIDARLKWPNDILVGGRKIAGILIESRSRDGEVFALIGTGLNVHPLGDDAPPNVVSIAESSSRDAIDLDSATKAFVEFIDGFLAEPLDDETTLTRWRELTVHASGDRIDCILGDRTISGTWQGIDESGRAMIRKGGETIYVAAGDLVMPA